MRIVFMLLTVIICAWSVEASDSMNGMVRYVPDGDTIILISRETGRATVRLYGIDAPEIRQPYGQIARRVLMFKLLGKPVSVEVKSRDQYGRVVGVVRQGRRDINAEMVSEGLAWAYRQYLSGSYASEYIGLEQGARHRRAGLWRQGNPQPPWEFRNVPVKPKKRRR